MYKYQRIAEDVHVQCDPSRSAACTAPLRVRLEGRRPKKPATVGICSQHPSKQEGLADVVDGGRGDGAGRMACTGWGREHVAAAQRRLRADTTPGSRSELSLDHKNEKSISKSRIARASSTKTPSITPACTGK